MKNLIEKIKSFFLPKKEGHERYYEEILYSEYIDALTEFSKQLGIIVRSIGPIDELSTGIGSCFTYNGSIIFLIYPHNICVKWNPLNENKFVKFVISFSIAFLLIKLILLLSKTYIKSSSVISSFVAEIFL